MNTISPKTCRISKGTTLKELANFFKLTEEQLKRYHNTYCPLDDLIGHDIPIHVTLIYVPPEDKVLREKIFNPSGGNFINYKTKNTLENKKSYQKRYGIIQKTFHNDEEKLKIHYEIEIKKNNFNVEVNRHLVYINHQRPDLIVEQIADKVGKNIHSDKLDVYAGLNIGSGVAILPNSGSTDIAALFFAGPQVGARYFFTPHMAANLEVGYGKTWVNEGLTFKLGK